MISYIWFNYIKNLFESKSQHDVSFDVVGESFFFVDPGAVQNVERGGVNFWGEG